MKKATLNVVAGLFAACFLFAPAGCDKKKDGGTDAPSASSEAARTEPAPGKRPMETTRPEATTAPRCPSAVKGAATTVGNLDGKVVVTVTHEQSAQRAEIQARAEGLARLVGTSGDKPECPVVLRHAKALSLAAVDGGTAVTISTDKVDWTTEKAESRLAAIREGKGGGGHRHGSGMGGGKGGGQGKAAGNKDGHAQ